MLRTSPVLFSLMVLGCGGSSASSTQTTTTTTTATQTSGSAQEPTFPMPTQDFLTYVVAEMIPQVCVPRSPLMACFPSIDADICARAFTAAMTVCGQEMQAQLPPSVDEASAEQVTVSVAQCAHTAYFSGLQQAGIAVTADCPVR